MPPRTAQLSYAADLKLRSAWWHSPLGDEVNTMKLAPSEKLIVVFNLFGSVEEDSGDLIQENPP